MPQPTVTPEIHEPLDVHGDFRAQVSLNLILGVNHLSDGVHFALGQIIALRAPIDVGLVEDLLRCSSPDPVNVRQGNLNALVLG